MYILYFYMRICYWGTVAIFHTLRFTQVLLLKTPLFNTCVSKLTYSIVTFIISGYIHCLQRNLKGLCSSATMYCLWQVCKLYWLQREVGKRTPSVVLEAYFLLRSFLKYVLLLLLLLLVVVVVVVVVILFFQGLTTKVCIIVIEHKLTVVHRLQVRNCWPFNVSCRALIQNFEACVASVSGFDCSHVHHVIVTDWRKLYIRLCVALMT
jgi:hypothetical protein